MAVIVYGRGQRVPSRVIAPPDPVNAESTPIRTGAHLERLGTGVAQFLDGVEHHLRRDAAVRIRDHDA